MIMVQSDTMKVDTDSLKSMPPQRQGLRHQATTVCSRRRLLWMAGLALSLLAGWLMWAAVDARWIVGALVGGAWLISVLIHVAFIDYLLRSASH